MSLDMQGHIDDVFESFQAVRYSKTGGSRDADGVWVPGSETTSNHSVTAQPVSDREFNALSNGNERIQDTRKIYVNDGVDASIQEADEWEFLGQRWRCLSLDNRPWRNYCKAVVTRLDVQP